MAGATYPELLRTPLHRWWRPLASAAVLLPLAGVITLLVYIVYSLGLTLAGVPVPAREHWMDDVSLLMPFMGLTNASMILVALAAVGAAHPVKARFLHSVEGRVRWRWLGRCVLVLLPVDIVLVAGIFLTSGVSPADVTVDGGAVRLLLSALLITPFQAAGEEYLCRGWILASLGSWFRRPGGAVAVASVVSGTVFAALHGSMDPWMFLALAADGAILVVLTWRTGGLEAAVAHHAVHNVVLLVPGALTGATEGMLVDETSAGVPAAVLVTTLVNGAFAALLLWQACRVGIARTVPEAIGATP
ncbi:CPBP family intramembrane glutamic endopeptidase [Mobilicoccus pelagius]|uniref:CAAX prenyl protease 2/Lysostaphin resistance protein A-like domain-containing protein n=1 Tax=Mobilicoccus pelagius NBRC 104925 TaxID=1089455 RepID=H5UMD3_9MICO|nr:type II CAAX endopeptidase family protein [Mobilicoccus pelagius]GAB46891.1 hypothetical protein MOPEL_001_00090 [Mobilicoccus pelagius NBRC 104925]